MAAVLASYACERLQSKAGLPFRLWLPNANEEEGDGEGEDVSLRCAGVEAWDQGDTGGLAACTPVASSSQI